MRSLANFILFQLGWFVAVLYRTFDDETTGVAVGAVDEKSGRIGVGHTATLVRN